MVGVEWGFPSVARPPQVFKSPFVAKHLQVFKSSSVAKHRQSLSPLCVTGLRHEILKTSATRSIPFYSSKCQEF